MNDLLDILERVVARAREGEAVEAYGLDSAETTVRVHGGEVESLSSAHTRGIGVRVLDGGRIGYAHTSDLSDETVAEALDEARTNAKAATPDDANVLPRPAPITAIEGLFDPGAADVPAERKVAVLLRAEEATHSAGEPIKGVDVAVYGDELTEAAIASSTGVRGAYRRSDAYLVVEAIAEADGASASSYGLSVTRHPDHLDPEAAAAEAVERASRLAGASKPRSATLPVVLDPSVAAALLAVLSGGLSAEAAQRGRSLFSDRVGDALGSAQLVLIDDGHRPDGFASAPWDGEGVPTGPTTLIDRGVLQGFLHNCRSAARVGAASTGNAQRTSHRAPPGIGATNLYLQPGSVGPDQLIAGVEHGFYCQQVMGLHSGVSSISGDLSVGASGLMIRDGEFAEPVREATIAGTIPRLLAGIETVGADLRFFPQHGGTGGQTLLIGEMTLAGA